MAEQTTEEKEECDPLRRLDYQRLSGVSSSSSISNCSSKRSRDGCSVLSDPRLSQLFHITQSLGKMADEFPEVCGERNINAEYPDQNKCKDALSELDKLNDDILRLTPGLRYSSMSDKRPSSSLGESCTPSPDLRGEEDIWKTRCTDLEESLGRFRDQANRIRDILQIKLSDLENRVEDSESRADTAEQKVQILIRRLEEIDWTPSEISQQAETFQKLVMEKETIIKSLESEVESQREQRLADAKLVEAKAARIKDWVTNKLRELEEQNTHLKQQNAYCNQQMELLRAQLERMQEDRRTRDSLEDSSIGSLDEEGGSEERRGSRGRGYRKTDRRSEGSLTSQSRKRLSKLPTTSASTDPLYAKVEPSRRKEERGSRSAEPRVQSKTAPSSYSGSSRSRDSRIDSLSVEFETPLDDPSHFKSNLEDMSELKSPKSPLEALDDALDLVMPSARFSIPIPPPRNKQKSGDTHSSSICQAGPVMSEEYSDYSEIFTPTDPRDRWDEHMVSAMSGNESMSACSSVRSVSVRSAPSCSVPAPAPVPSPPSAPAPPLHKVPSWENRIYEAATSQIILGAEMDCSNNNIDQPVLATFQDTLSVPVFAAIKGRASRVQSWPVNGDASDSSDGEEGRQGDEEEEGRQGDGEKEKVGEGRENEGRNRESRLNSRHIRDISIDSDLSGDYAFPPDELTLPTRSSFLESSRVGERSYEKCGYLTKLGGKFKSWQKRYFQLKDGNLAYWKSHHDMDRKPQGVILLTETCRVQRAEGSTTFQVTLQDRIHYLTADSLVVAEEWVSQLQNVVQMNALRIVLSKENTTPTLQGWLIKVKHGHSRRCWCVLLGKMFVYFKTPTDQNPLGQINMRDSRVEEVEHISDSDSETGDGLEESHPTLGIFPNHVHQGPTYLIFPNKSEEEKWLYQLTVVSGGDPKAGTQFEQLLQKLMESEGDTGNVLWKHPVMVYNKDPLSSPLTTLPTDILQAEAVKLFKSVNLFCSVVLDSSGIDYHVVLVQNTIQQCLQTPQLQAELFAILAKQTSRHAANRHGVQSFLLNATSIFSCDSSGGVSSPPDTSPTSSQLSKSNPPDTTFIQAWMLMAVAVSIFVPRNNRLLWFLRTHLARNKDSKSETGKYAAYCSKALERCVNNGSRVAKPSRLEVLSILLKNPHHHSLPHAVPVHLLNGTYQVVGFDGSTTIEEFEATLTDLINCRPANQSGFSIFSDDPLDPTLHHSLAKQEKVCDVLSGWETALRERGSGKFQNKRAIKFTFKNRLYWKKGVLNETEKEKLLYCYQVSEQIVSGKFPVNQELAFELAALMAQIEFGDVDKQHVGEVLNRFYPARYSTDKQQHQTLINRWSQLSGKTGSDCVRILLTCTRKWQFFGANLFQVQEVPEGNLQWLAVTDDGIAVLDPGSLQVVSRYPYSTVVSFGGCGDNFMLVVLVSSTLNNTNKTNKLIFSTTKVKILELTVVIADYMNALGQIIPISRPKSRSVSQSRPSAPSTPKLQRDRCLERNSSSVSTIKGKRSKSAGRREYKS